MKKSCNSVSFFPNSRTEWRNLLVEELTKNGFSWNPIEPEKIRFLHPRATLCAKRTRLRDTRAYRPPLLPKVFRNCANRVSCDTAETGRPLLTHRRDSIARRLTRIIHWNFGNLSMLAGEVYHLGLYLLITGHFVQLFVTDSRVIENSLLGSACFCFAKDEDGSKVVKAGWKIVLFGERLGGKGTHVSSVSM